MAEGGVVNTAPAQKSTWSNLYDFLFGRKALQQAAQTSPSPSPQQPQTDISAIKRAALEAAERMQKAKDENKGVVPKAFGRGGIVRYGGYGNPRKMEEGGIVDSEVESWRRIPTKDEPQFKPAQSFLERNIKPMMADTGMSPTPLGLVMKNPANAARILKMMQESLPGESSQVEKAIAYVKAKYPKLSGMVKNISHEKRPLTDLGGYPVENDTYGMYMPERANLGTIKVASEENAPESVRNLGHELTHALQDYRSARVPLFPKTYPSYKPSGEQAEPIYRPSLSGPGLGRTGERGPFLGHDYPSYISAHNEYGYDKNPYEIQAGKGGSTASKTFLEFLKHIADKD